MLSGRLVSNYVSSSLSQDIVFFFFALQYFVTKCERKFVCSRWERGSGCFRVSGNRNVKVWSFFLLFFLTRSVCVKQVGNVLTLITFSVVLLGQGCIPCLVTLCLLVLSCLGDVCVFSCAKLLASFPLDRFPQVLLHTDSVRVQTDKVWSVLCTVQMDIFGTWTGEWCNGHHPTQHPCMFTLPPSPPPLPALLYVNAEYYAHVTQSETHRFKPQWFVATYFSMPCNTACARADVWRVADWPLLWSLVSQVFLFLFLEI